MNCRFCGTVLDEFLTSQGLDIHPMCDRDEENVMAERNAELKSQLMEIINWADTHSARSQQVAIGPSEIGNPCDQRVARVLAGMEQKNGRFDPWAGIVGTSIHAWMQNAVDRYLKESGLPAGHPLRAWKTEVRVKADDLIAGSSDLYTGDVVDYKSSSSDKIKVMRAKGKEAIPPSYLVQGHIYGLGQDKAGRPVRDIVLVFMPRNGLIKDMYLYREPYDVDVALKALDRMYRIADELIEANLPESGDWSTIEMMPSNDCWYCPFYVDRPAEQGPDAYGCPGNSKPLEERQTSASARFDKDFL